MKLDRSDVQLIFQCVEERQKLKTQIGELTNKKLAEKFGIHESTIEKILAGRIHKFIAYKKV